MPSHLLPRYWQHSAAHSRGFPSWTVQLALYTSTSRGSSSRLHAWAWLLFLSWEPTWPSPHLIHTLPLSPVCSLLPRLHHNSWHQPSYCFSMHGHFLVGGSKNTYFLYFKGYIGSYYTSFPKFDRFLKHTSQTNALPWSLLFSQQSKQLYMGAIWTCLIRYLFAPIWTCLIHYLFTPIIEILTFISKHFCHCILLLLGLLVVLSLPILLVVFMYLSWTLFFFSFLRFVGVGFCRPEVVVYWILIGYVSSKIPKWLVVLFSLLLPCFNVSGMAQRRDFSSPKRPPAGTFEKNSNTLLLWALLHWLKVPLVVLYMVFCLLTFAECWQLVKVNLVIILMCVYDTFFLLD